MKEAGFESTVKDMMDGADSSAAVVTLSAMGWIVRPVLLETRTSSMFASRTGPRRTNWRPNCVGSCYGVSAPLSRYGCETRRSVALSVWRGGRDFEL